MPLNASTPFASRRPPHTEPACVRTPRSNPADVALLEPCMVTSPGQSHMGELGLHGSRRPPESGLLTMRICELRRERTPHPEEPAEAGVSKDAAAKPLAMVR